MSYTIRLTDEQRTIVLAALRTARDEAWGAKAERLRDTYEVVAGQPSNDDLIAEARVR